MGSLMKIFMKNKKSDYINKYIFEYIHFIIYS
jgi:hypothetical protein